ncbi:glycosyltransferase family 2 protein [Mucilaginibacter sp.]|uniref:glycosyltransferase family 2 protein n=1 Tax=Mucilaginibacter sp. TaxID=1882438 RepID=UPI003D0E51DD
MQDFKISLITVSFNAEGTIRRCIESVISQNFKAIEYIIIDGGSIDQTINIINQYKNNISIILSEPDKGIYDAMNKGIKLATGDVVGMLNADDFFADDKVLSTVADAFIQQNVEITYGDLDYVSLDDKIIRKWRSGKYLRSNFSWGWMPPHPTFYCKRNLFEKLGFYSLGYGTAADYELMLRFMFLNRIPAFYIKKVLVKMKVGGVSNKSFNSRVKGLKFDLKAMRNNGIIYPIITLILKPARKIIQYF